MSGHEMEGMTEFGPRTCIDLGSFLRNEAKAGHETDPKKRLDKNGFSRQSIQCDCDQSRILP